MPPTPSRRRRKAIAILAAGLTLPLLAFGLYTSVALNWSYSDGERAGVLQKFSRKGWVCKTWEGELAMTTVPGVAPELWEFTVRDDEVARQVNAALGKRVTLHYREHPGVPTSCFGQTPYYVDALRPLP
ncbi:MAG: hypothetical protein ACREOC_00460 [Gemmatimonadales bacterium]